MALCNNLYFDKSFQSFCLLEEGIHPILLMLKLYLCTGMCRKYYSNQTCQVLIDFKCNILQSSSIIVIYLCYSLIHFPFSVNIHWLPGSEANHSGSRDEHDRDSTIHAANSIPWVSRHLASIHRNDFGRTGYVHLEANTGPRKIHACT